MLAAPFVSFCTCAKDFSVVLSINGKTVFVEDLQLKNRVLDENPRIKEIYQSGGNPTFRVFYIDVEEIETFSFDKGAVSYEF
jgi:uncharacterized pyridoxamine 5'-phosphate oxidase family protein